MEGYAIYTVFFPVFACNFAGWSACTLLECDLHVRKFCDIVQRLHKELGCIFYLHMKLISFYCYYLAQTITIRYDKAFCSYM